MEARLLIETIFLFYWGAAAPGLSLVSGWASSGGEPWITHFEFSTVGPLLRSWRQVIPWGGTILLLLVIFDSLVPGMLLYTVHHGLDFGDPLQVEIFGIFLFSVLPS